MSQSLTAGSQPPPPQDSRPVKEQPYHERTHEHNWRHGHYLPDYLTGDERVDIQVSFVLGGVHRIDGGLRVYMVLKFFYDKKVLDYLHIPENEKPTQYPYTLKKQHQHCTRWVPFCFVGCFDEQHINWRIDIKADGSCYERLEFYANFTVLEHQNYHPFALNALSFRIALDGSGRSGDINLIPLLVKEDGDYCTRTKNYYKPDVEYQVFTKDTAIETLQNLNKDAHTVMMVRRQEQSGVKGIYTRVYAVLLFENEWFEEYLKYIFLSSLLLFILPFCVGPEESVIESFSATLTMILTQVALLFVYPENYCFSTTEKVIVFQILSTIFLTILIGFGFGADEGPDWGFGENASPNLNVFYYVIAQNVIATFILFRGRVAYTSLRDKIHSVLNFDNQFHLCEFEELENLI